MGQGPQGQKRKEKGKPKVHALTTMRVGVCAGRQHVASVTPVVIVVGTIKRVTTFAPKMEAKKVKKGEKVKGVTLEKRKETKVKQERVDGSARDSAEPGAVATLGHPKRQAKKIPAWMEAQLTQNQGKWQ